MVSLTEYTAILSAAVGVVATAFILLQIRHMDKHRNLDISMRLFEWAESDRLRKAFRWVDEEFEFVDYGKYRAREKTSLEASNHPYEVTEFLEQVGFLAEKFVDLEVIVDRLGGQIISSWQKLEPWVMALRKEKKDETFGEHFQRLYEKTAEYMESRNS